MTIKRSQSLLATAAVTALAGLGLQSQVQASPTLYWDFNSTSGTTVNDLSGNGHTGTYTGGASSSAPTPTTTTLNSYTPTAVGNFNGTSQSVTSSWTASSLGIGGNNPKSISVWANVPASNWTGSQSQAGLFEVGSDSNANDFSLRIKGTADGGNASDWRAQFWGGDTDFTVPNSAGNWTHFVLIYDPTKSVYTDHTVNIFANGAKIATGDETLNTSDSPKTFAAAQWTNSGDPANPVVNYLQGQLDDLAVYNQALTPDQVTALFNGASPNSVPEPATLGLVGVAGLLVLRRRRTTA